MTELTLSGFKTKKFGNNILITTPSGNWDFIPINKYNDLISGKYTSKNDLKVTKEFDRKSDLIDYKNFNYYYKLKASLNIFVLTKRCNLNCNYCHNFLTNSYDSSFDMSIETAKKFLKFIDTIPGNSASIEFQGGEPTLNFETLKFIVKNAKTFIKNKNIRFSLVTNLTNLNDDYVEFLIKNNVNITSSLDGPKKVNDMQRLSPGSSYDILRENYFFLKEFYNLKIGLLLVFTKKSIEYYKSIIEEYLVFNLDSIQLKYLSKLGRANSNWNNLSLSVDGFLIYLEKSLDYIISLNKRGFNLRSRYMDLIYAKFYLKNPYDYVDFRSPCGMAIGQILYDYDGSIYPCDEARAFSEFKIGNVNMNYKQILKNPKTKKLILSSLNKNYLCENCVYQPYCGVCPILNYAETGTLELLDSNNGHCKYFKFLFDYFFKNIVSKKDNLEIFYSLSKDKKISPDIVIRNIEKDFVNYVENKKNLEIETKTGKVKKYIKLDFNTFFVREAEFLDNIFNIEKLMNDLKQPFFKFFKLNSNYYELNNNFTNHLPDKKYYQEIINKINSLELLHRIQTLSYFIKVDDYDGNKNFIFPFNITKNRNDLNIKKPFFIFKVSEKFISEFFDFNNGKKVSNKFRKVMNFLNDVVINYGSF